MILTVFEGFFNLLQISISLIKRYGECYNTLNFLIAGFLVNFKDSFF